MKLIKKCIFHVPNFIDIHGNSGSTVRPMKMLNAFKENGYEVDIIMGDKKQRKLQIKKIKSNIEKGLKYDFVYSESSTMPTLLTEKNHIPTIPPIDFNFFKYCKKKGIKIGLYYRDIYWRFPSYGQKMNFFKKNFAMFMYKYDLYQYKKYVDIFYLQSLRMKKYLPSKFQKMIIKALPPGGEMNKYIINDRKKYYNSRDKNKINIFYVGGIGVLYDIENILKLAFNKSYINLIICCRKNEWEKEKKKYENYLNNRIKIIHKTKDELQEYYNNADICSLYFPENEYRNFVLPIKLFEYLENVSPIISTRGTETGKFVTENNIGWEIKGDYDELERVIEEIYNNQKEINNKHLNCVKVIENNTWKCRAKIVINDLLKK